MSWELFINTNMWMDIYGYIFMRVLKTGYHAWNINTDVDYAVTQSSAYCITENGYVSLSAT